MLPYDPVSFEPRRPVTWEGKGESATPHLAPRVILWSQNEESSIWLHAECIFHFLLKIYILLIWLMLSSTVTYRYRHIFISMCAPWILNTWLLDVSSIMFHLSQRNINFIIINSSSVSTFSYASCTFSASLLWVLLLLQIWNIKIH